MADVDLTKYNPEEPRGQHGEWTADGGGSDGGGSSGGGGSGGSSGGGKDVGTISHAQFMSWFGSGKSKKALRKKAAKHKRLAKTHRTRARKAKTARLRNKHTRLAKHHAAMAKHATRALRQRGTKRPKAPTLEAGGKTKPLYGKPN